MAVLPDGSDDAAGLPAQLRDLRARLGLSQEQLARRLDVSFATVNRWETGRTRPAPRAVAALAQLLAAPPTPSTLPTAPATGSLDPSGFVGRADELAELTTMLADGRPLFLVGPGGCGKSRLARRLAAGSGRRVTVVQLGSLHSADALPATVAASLGARDRAGVPLRDSIAAALDDTATLLIIDAAEQVIDAAAEFAAHLLADTPTLRVIVTTRRVPMLPHVRTYAVPPLACPPPSVSAGEIASSDAVSLFVLRARETLPDFDLEVAGHAAVAELCRRLGGIPLAIELIAPWVGTLSVAEILDHRVALLHGRRSRQDLLRGVFEASFDVLDEDEQALLPVLGAFVGPFTLADAGEVTAIPDDVLVHSLRGLVQTSWLQVRRGSPHTHFVLLDPTREFAADVLMKSGNQLEVDARHARHFTTLALDSEDGLASAGGMSWRERMAAAWPDVQRALERSIAEGEVALGLDAGAALWRWWLITGRLVEGRRWLARLLEAATSGAASDVGGADVGGADVGGAGVRARGRAMASSAVLAVENGDYHGAIDLGEQALAVFEAIEQTEQAAFAATVVGSARRYLGDLPAAQAHFERALSLRRALGDRRGVAVGLNNLALLALDENDLVRARELFEDSLLLKRELGEPRSVAIGLANLSDVLIRTRQPDRAVTAIAEAVGLAELLGDRQLIGTLRCNQGDIDAGRGDWASAAVRFADAAEQHRAAGHLHDVVVALLGLSRAESRLGRTDAAVARLREAEAVATGTTNATQLALVRSELAELGEVTTISPPPGITAREAEILGQLGRGSTNKQIAADLHLSVSTVERHLATTYRKLGLRGRVDAARFAVAHGLSPTPR